MEKELCGEVAGTHTSWCWGSWWDRGQPVGEDKGLAQVMLWYTSDTEQLIKEVKQMKPSLEYEEVVPRKATELILLEAFPKPGNA